MRLKEYAIEVIKKYFNKYFGDIYLFGSRVYDNKIGSDIDLYFIYLIKS